MRNAMKTITNQKSDRHKSSASVVDGKLILSFPDSIAPIVWQMDLGQAKASALEVRHNEENETHTLVLKTPRGEVTEIASFETKQQAVDGLMAASKALEKGRGQIRDRGENSEKPYKLHHKARKRPIIRKFVGFISIVLLLLVLLGIWGSLLPRPPAGSISQANFGDAAGTGNFDSAAGVPVSADEFLKGR